jgi:hypothetical protein
MTTPVVGNVGVCASNGNATPPKSSPSVITTIMIIRTVISTVVIIFPVAESFVARGTFTIKYAPHVAQDIPNTLRVYSSSSGFFRLSYAVPSGSLDRVPTADR